LNKKRNIVTVLGWIFVVCIIIFSFINKAEKPPATAELYTMNTIVNIKIYGNNKEIILKELIKKIEEINSYIDSFSPSSDIYKINENAGIKTVAVHPETIAIIEKALELAHNTNGAFNPLITPLSQIWGFRDKNYRIPSEKEIEDALNLTDYNDIIINKDTVFLKKEGEALDLGGIAKGYTLDCLKEILDKMNGERALINIGGNILLYGTPPDKQWKIGIKNPREDGIIGALNIEGTKFISTSGDYERFFIKDNKRYCHLISPFNGYPADKIFSVTVVSDKGYYGDALSTAFFITGKNDALQDVKKFEVDIIVIDKDLNVFCSEELKDSFIPENEKG
jgi:thiamine biosynthesis lipoprotein